MMTSRSEYRLLLRQDNARERLMPIGHRIGLVSDTRYEEFLSEKEQIRAEVERIEKTNISPSDTLAKILEENESTPISTGIKLGELMRRPELSYKKLTPIDKNRPLLPERVVASAEIEVKYSGYIKRQLAEVEKLARLENRKLPADFDYSEITGLRLEAIAKLNKVKPENIGQASRISGVSPADVSVLLIYFENQKYRKTKENEGNL